MKRKWTITGIIALTILGVAYWIVFTENPEATAVVSRYEKFYDAMVDKDYTIAFALTSPKYRREYDLERFKQDFSFSAQSWLRLEPGYHIRIQANRAWLYPRKSGFFELWAGPEYEWIKIENNWYLTGKYEWYLD